MRYSLSRNRRRAASSCVVRRTPLLRVLPVAGIFRFGMYVPKKRAAATSAGWRKVLAGSETGGRGGAIAAEGPEGKLA